MFPGKKGRKCHLHPMSYGPSFYFVHTVYLLSPRQLRLVAVHASLTQRKPSPDVLCAHGFTVRQGTRFLRQTEGDATIETVRFMPSVPPPPSLPHPSRLVPAMTDWRWALALAAVQPDSLSLSLSISSAPQKAFHGAQE